MQRWLELVVFISIFACISADCSWKSCGTWKKDQLNVHLIPHSHDDAGWLKTVDQYYWGANRSIAPGAVKYTLDTVISELKANPNRKFSYCETSFFWRWWMQQADFNRHQVRKLVNDGQLEFIGGGWVQNDEAAAHYTAMIDQMTAGLRKLNETFGECGNPKAAWQIDPFGHSKEQASIFAEMGFWGLFFSRLHYLDHAKRIIRKEMELNWQGSADLGASSNLLTGVMFDGYGPPPGFCFDAYCEDDLMMDDKRLEGYNVDAKVKAFTDFARLQSKAYKTNHILIPMGSDFHFTNAQMWFENMDKLIQYVNQKNEINVVYSTPGCYLKALRESGQSWPAKTDDFFPYASDPHSYWTGFYTSRPALKGYIRKTNAYMQMCKQLDANAQLGPEDLSDMDNLISAMGLVQHHDAVTGTARQHVTNDYEKRLHHGLMECQQVVNDAFAKLMVKSSAASAPQQSFCLWSNETVCSVSQTSSKFTFTVFNSLTQTLNTTIRIPVSRSGYTVTGPDNKPVPTTQIVKPFLPQSQFSYVKSPANYELIVPVQIPPVGFATFHAKASAAFPRRRNLRGHRIGRSIPRRKMANPLLSLKSNMLEVSFDPRTGLMSSISDVRSGHSVTVNQNFFWYKAAVGKNQDPLGLDRASGAYIFRPNGTQATPVTTSVHVDSVTGALVKEMRQTFNSWVSQVVRVYNDKPYVELEWTIGPIPFKDGIGKEIVSRFETNSIANGGVFMTDANGRQMLGRKYSRAHEWERNQQSTYSYNNSEPVSGNYYPVNAHISIKDSNLQLAILTDRSQGGSSLQDGQIELMVHRRLLNHDAPGVGEPLNETGVDGRGLVVRGKHWLVLSQPNKKTSPSTVHRRLLNDDAFGVGEPLNETGVDGKGLVVRGRQWVVLSTPDKASALHRTLAQEMFHQPIVTFAATEQEHDEYQADFRTLFAGLTRPLPDNVALLTLEQWQGATVLVRFEHLFQKDEDAKLSLPVTVDLNGLFTAFDIVSMEELSLGANNVTQTEAMDEFPPRELNRWETRQTYQQQEDCCKITLKPMQIRTYRCTIKTKEY